MSNDQNWIKCTDRLPQSFEEVRHDETLGAELVLIYLGNGVTFTGFLFDKAGTKWGIPTEYGEDELVNAPTHWMPLPTFPTD